MSDVGDELGSDEDIATVNPKQRMFVTEAIIGNCRLAGQSAL
jgi:hypothetical protein